MDQEYPVNIAVFEYQQNGQILNAKSASVTTKDDAILHGLNGIEQISRESNYPVTLLEIYSEWKPSAALLEKIISQYPDIKLTWSFKEGDEKRFKAEMDKLYNDPKG